MVLCNVYPPWRINVEHAVVNLVLNIGAICYDFTDILYQERSEYKILELLI